MLSVYSPLPKPLNFSENGSKKGGLLGFLPPSSDKISSGSFLLLQSESALDFAFVIGSVGFFS